MSLFLPYGEIKSFSVNFPDIPIKEEIKKLRSKEIEK